MLVYVRREGLPSRDISRRRGTAKVEGGLSGCRCSADVSLELKDMCRGGLCVSFSGG